MSTVIRRQKPGQANDARPVCITLDVLERSCANMSLVKASIMFGISPTSMKKACRRLGITRWPPPVGTEQAAPAQIDGAYVRRIQRKHAASMPKASETSAGGSAGSASLQAVVNADTTPSLAAKQFCDWSSSAEAAGLSAPAASAPSSGQMHTREMQRLESQRRRIASNKAILQQVRQDAQTFLLQEQQRHHERTNPMPAIAIDAVCPPKMYPELPPAGVPKLLEYVKGFNSTLDIGAFAEQVKELVDEYDVKAKLHADGHLQASSLHPQPPSVWLVAHRLKTSALTQGI